MYVNKSNPICHIANIYFLASHGVSDKQKWLLLYVGTQ